jgi:beta-lactamase class A
LDDGYYGVGRLISQSIIESDNTAAAALYINKPNEHEELYNVLRLPYPPEKLADYMSPRQVSYIFRALYGSTYLLNSYSEQVLELLTRTHFDKGITQGVESDIKVAHKFGEHMTYYSDGATPPDHQLHDCGIVYYPEKPYFICVMTEGKKLEDLEKILQDISAITFKFVKEHKL